MRAFVWKCSNGMGSSESLYFDFQTQRPNIFETSGKIQALPWVRLFTDLFSFTPQSPWEVGALIPILQTRRMRLNLR